MRMKYMIGKKLGMMQIFDAEKNTARAVTLFDIQPMTVVQVKTSEKDGYSAVQVGYGTKKHQTKPLQGHTRGLGSFAGLKEFRIGQDEISQYEQGKKIGVDIFQVGDSVSATGLTKGRGFAGAVKRHGFHGGPKSHGQKHSLRRVGSIGGSFPQRVLKNTRMAGHMGTERVTVQNLRVAQINPETNVLAVYGAVPSFSGAWIEITGKQS